MRLNSFLVIALFLVAGFALPAAGDVFNMPSGLTSLETVPVGAPGNAPDLRYGNQGAVDYSYSIGKYPVTAGQYCQFLNAVAATDTYGLYLINMDTAVIAYGCNIKRAGDSGSYTYSVAADWANRPVNEVSYWDACRFTNWLCNGQPTGPQGPGTTETGAYTLEGYTGNDGRGIVRNPGATWALPSDAEWYKAAYYKASGANAGYWTYPTRSDTAPSNVFDPAGINNANYKTLAGVFTIGAPYYRTEVGAFAGSPGPYGTFDQAGNVDEWTEAIDFVYYDGSASRRQRGSSYYFSLSSGPNNKFGHVPDADIFDGGFRVVLVPEPGCVLIFMFGALTLLRNRPRR